MPKKQDAGAIYRAYEKAFAQVSAWLVLKDGEVVARLSVKYPPTGHGERRVTAFVHVLGVPMVKGWADGYGYDKTTAALASACERLPVWEETFQEAAQWPGTFNTLEAFRGLKDQGHDIPHQLRAMGYQVEQVM